jgi:hypothetical protein
MARTAAKKTTARRATKTAAPATKTTVPAVTSAAPRPAATSAGVPDLAGGMRALLVQIEDEVRAVGKLSEQIDDLVRQLNGRREEQAARLLALDALQSSVSDAGLSSFLDKAIRPRKTRVPEVVPERLAK